MKKIIKKIMAIILVIITILANGRIVVVASDYGMELYFDTSSKLRSGQEVEITMYVRGFTNSNAQIENIRGTLEYNKDIFEALGDSALRDRKLVGPGNNTAGWIVGMYSDRSNKMILNKMDGLTNIGENNFEILKIFLTVKENVNLDETTLEQRTIKFKNISASGGDTGDVYAADIYITLGIEDNELYIYSDDNQYYIDGLGQEEKFIQLVSPETDISHFMSHIETNAKDIVVEMNNKNVIVRQGGIDLDVTEEDFIGTGAKLNIAFYEQNYSYEIVVIGDINGDGRISITDYTILGQHLSTTNKRITDVAKFKAADLNFDGDLKGSKNISGATMEGVTISDLVEMARILVEEDSKVEERINNLLDNGYYKLIN